MTATVLRADARRLPLPDASVDLICTSPPYWALRSYTDGGEHYDGQIGSEPTWQQWLANLLDCTREWARVLKPTGSMFVNLGDKYSGGASGQQSGLLAHPSHTRGGMQPHSIQAKPVSGLPPKSLLLLPERYVIACTDQLGLIARRDIIWAKPNGLPESVTDRCRSSHEYLFHLVKQPRYYAAVDEIRTPHAQSTMTRGGGRNGLRIRQQPNPSGTITEGRHDWEGGLNALGSLPGSVWNIPSQPLTIPAHLGIDHFAAFPMELPRRVILGWSPPGICTGCGEGRRPVVDKGGPDPDLLARRGLTAAKWHEEGAPRGRIDRWNISGEEMRRTAIPTTISGYVCACPTPDAPTRPALVLDPFCGTGTTMLVASVLGRHGIGTDLSLDYCRLAKWRTSDPGERARAMEVPKPPKQLDGQEALWA